MKRAVYKRGQAWKERRGSRVRMIYYADEFEVDWHRPDSDFLYRSSLRAWERWIVRSGAELVDDKPDITKFPDGEAHGPCAFVASATPDAKERGRE